MKSHVVFAALLVCLAVAPSPALAQQQGEEGRDRQQVEAMEGELMKVDTESRTINVKAPNGAEVQFAYTNETVITGSTEQTQGLATIEGTHVRVFFTRSDETYTATRVVVEPE
jgi:predicted secreted protein